MDPQRFKAAYGRLQTLDERLTHKIRPRRGRPLTRPTADVLEEELRDLAEFTIELKEIVAELFLALGGKPAADEQRS
jgi:hypothetical protein